ncbi:renin receptor [Hyposmocoma kahamanoa]|uniref:renin receptor n=1 Tax=Hyposmocoma kahamanoa TaxID=1477025 RepID=UPI000E6D7C2E|nr:renin receptor [Hyposmocoma kahamanoa]
MKMAVKMVLFGFSLVLLVIGSNAAGEFTVLYSPDSIKFSSQTPIQESVLKEVFSASLGLSVEEDTEWNGLHIIDPFSTPEAAVEIYVDGVSSLETQKERRFPLVVDEYEPDTYNSLEHRVKQRFTEGDNKLVNIKLSDFSQLSAYSSIFGDIPTPKVSKLSLQHLKYSTEEDYQFLIELEALKAITVRVKMGVLKPDNLIDFYNFRFTSLHALSDFHGPNSLATKEAKKLLTSEIKHLSDAFVKAYDGSVVVAVVATDVAHTRRTIRAVQFSDPDASEDYYSGDYPCIFNIIFWFVVVLTFTLVAIVYAIMDMDPGRDSIIYRMTSMRAKKDN